jgi:GNAT superfamily N-acetyltransferase
MTTVRDAKPDEVPAVARVLEGALLEVPLDLTAACSDGRVLTTGNPPYGVLVVAPSVAGARIVGLAVTPRRRGEGVARTLVETALEEWRPLSATIDARVRPVYEALGFAIVSVGETRYRAVRR